MSCRILNNVRQVIDIKEEKDRTKYATFWNSGRNWFLEEVAPRVVTRPSNHQPLVHQWITYLDNCWRESVVISSVLLLWINGEPGRITSIQSSIAFTARCFLSFWVILIRLKKGIVVCHQQRRGHKVWLLYLYEVLPSVIFVHRPHNAWPWKQESLL
jgi:hypothetical protein